MRITRDALLKLAQNTVAERTYQDRHIICIYLTGSMLSEEPLLGGTTDIDLIFVHDTEQAQRREIARSNREVHLGIAHLGQAVYQHPRHLRLDPWVGSFLIADPICLHDLGHWFEFTQASVSAQFKRPENVIRRARPFAEAARRTWLDLDEDQIKPGPQKISAYLKGLETAATSIAILTGVPLTERRFILDFPERAAALERPGLSGGLRDLFMGQPIPAETWTDWLNQWQTAMREAAALENAPLPLSKIKHPYYINAAEALFPDHPAAAVWILLRTWTNAVCLLAEDSPSTQYWQEALQVINLDETHFTERIKAFDAYQDTVEETLDIWAQQNGIEA